MPAKEMGLPDVPGGDDEVFLHGSWLEGSPAESGVARREAFAGRVCGLGERAVYGNDG